MCFLYADDVQRCSASWQHSRASTGQTAAAGHPADDYVLGRRRAHVRSVRSGSRSCRSWRPQPGLNLEALGPSSSGLGAPTVNSRSIPAQTPWKAADHCGAKPPKNQQDAKPALTYEPGGRTFESCRAHHPNSVGMVTPLHPTSSRTLASPRREDGRVVQGAPAPSPCPVRLVEGPGRVRAPECQPRWPQGCPSCRSAAAPPLTPLVRGGASSYRWPRDPDGPFFGPQTAHERRNTEVARNAPVSLRWLHRSAPRRSARQCRANSCHQGDRTRTTSIAGPFQRPWGELNATQGRTPSSTSINLRDKLGQAEPSAPCAWYSVASN